MRPASLRSFTCVANLFRERAGRSDVMVVAAALTSYAAFGLIPVVAIGTRVAAWCFGAEEVTSAAQGLARFLHGPLGLDEQVVEFARSAASAPWWTVLVALVPVSLYQKGLYAVSNASRARRNGSRGQCAGAR